MAKAFNKTDKWDFSGWATKVDLVCTDGRTIKSGAFKANHGKTVPLVWQHFHNDPTNILGHAYLEERPEGVYAYGKFNATAAGQNGKLLVDHGDITHLSIYANQLVQKGNDVVHGQIREVSLVLSGANPGAVIETPTILHGDGSETEEDGTAIISTGIEVELFHAEEPAKEDKEETLGEIFNTLSEEQKDAVYVIIAAAVEPQDDSSDGESMSQADNSGEGKTVQDVFNTLSEKQKTVVYALIASVSEAVESGSDFTHSDISEDGEEKIMKNNVFNKEEQKNDRFVLSHDDFATIVRDAQLNGGSLKQSVLIHAGDYGIDDIDMMFPTARTVADAPDMISRNMEWVNVVLNGVRKSPFSRIKSLAADITEPEARAKGYVKGALKTNEVIKLLTRTTIPTTIYKKQKLDRDDILDITDFDVVSWLKGEMQVMLNEEKARAMLLGDGRLANSPDKINEDHIRPIYTDNDIYAHHVRIAAEHEAEEIIEDMIRARSEYKGSGNPMLFASTTVVADMLLVKDNNGRRLYATQAELETVLRVSKIVEVNLMDDMFRMSDDVVPVQLNLIAIIVNPRDYTVGADKGGDVSFFDDFDLDYNQQKYLLETRMCGCLTMPKSALVFEQVAPDEEG